MSDFELQPAKPKPNQRTVAGPHRATARTDTWLTPPYILKALGEFDLDPCAAPEPRPWPTASRHITLPTNGLQIEWHGRVWLNPPYGRATGTWLEKLANHGNGIALIFARTDTDMFFEQVWKRADAVAFLRGRLTFCDAAGRIASFNAGGPSCLVAYGLSCALLLRYAAIDLGAHFVTLQNQSL